MEGGGVNRTAESVVLHAVGATGSSQRKTIGWRRYYYTSPDDIACQDAVARGWMVARPGMSDDVYFVVTDEGLAWASDHTGREVDADA